MSKFIIVSTRPNTSIPFFEMPIEAQAHVQTTYIDTGKLTSVDVVLSDDQLTRTDTKTFSDDAAVMAYRCDFELASVRNDRNSYNSSNGIISASNTL